MEDIKNIALGRVGQNMDSHPSQLREEEYSYSLNSNKEHSDGQGILLQSEQSNLLCNRFSSGYKVIGRSLNINTDRVYFFLTNPSTGASEIGYISSIQNITHITEADSQCGCDFKKILDTPLEEQEQIEHCEFTSIMRDDCNLCLNFSIYHPMKSIVFKEDNMYFTDDYNPPRYIKLDKIDEYQYFRGPVCDDEPILNCEEDEICEECEECEQCPNCDRLKIFGDFSAPCYHPELLINGGNLKMGSYQFAIALSDSTGAELSEYYSLTPNVNIFDQYNNIMDQTELARETNYGIRVKVEELDRSYEYYKVIVIQSTAEDGAYRSYIVGVFPTSTTTFTYTTENNKATITFQEIYAIKTKWERSKGLTASGNTLFQHGLTAQEEINLQPVVILMSAFMYWASGVAKENLYADGVADANYGQYMRNEQYPFAIKFGTTDGYISTPFIFTHRPPTAEELEFVVVDGVGINDDIASIMRFTPECNFTRDRRWQYYNTAELINCDPEAEGAQCCQEFDGAVDCCEFDPETDSGTLVTQTIVSKCVDEVLDENTGDMSQRTVTLTGTSGTANITVTGTGTAYLVTFNTSLTQTATDFVTTHASDLLADEGITVLSSGATIIFRHTTTGFPTITAPINATGDLAGSIGTLTALGSITIQLPPTYTNFPDFINANIPPVSAVNKFGPGEEFEDPYIFSITSDPYDGTGDHDAVEYCVPEVGDNCKCEGSEPERTESNVFVSEVFSEEIVFNPKDLDDYEPKSAPTICNAYKFGNDETGRDHDEIFGDTYLGGDSAGGNPAAVFVRNPLTSMETCSGAVDITTLGNTGYYMDYLGDPTTITNLQEATIAITGACVTGGFTAFLHKKARWFKFSGFDPVTGKGLLEVRPSTPCDIEEDFAPNREVRISTYETCASTSNIDCFIADLDDGLIVELDIADYPGAANDEIFIAVDAPIENPSGTLYYINPPCGCFALTTRAYEFEDSTVSWTRIIVSRESIYESTCCFVVPEPDECKVAPYLEGKFGYWESTRTYPDNKELFDASGLKISSTSIPSKIKQFFEDYFTDGGEVDDDNNYVLNQDGTTQLYCKPIRAYKMPGNDIAPFMINTPLPGFQNSLIFPLGVKLDNDVINFFLDMAVVNNLITQELRDKITRYEILRGDRTLDKSIVAKGLIFDTYKYQKEGQDIYHPNFPYNSLGNDPYHFSGASGGPFVEHPFPTGGGDQNNRFTFHSAETHFMTPPPFLPDEMEYEGYQYGRSRGNFKEVDGHPKYVILGRSAYRIAMTLAITEAALEAAIQIGTAFLEYSKNFAFTAGVSSGANVGGIIMGAIQVALISTAVTAAAVQNTGRYRYQWLTIFRNNGKPSNFAYYYASHGWYNYMSYEHLEGDKLRGLAAAEYLKGGGRRAIVEKGEGIPTKFNNDDRESSVYISFGSNFPLHYTDRYRTYDNYSSDPFTSSRNVNSDSAECDGREFDSNIASPYISLKRFVAEQYGDIHNIKWLPTNYCGKLLEENHCEIIWGGDTKISRLSLKRKIPFFLVNAMGQADFTPFAYQLYNNVGNVRFFANFDIELSENIFASIAETIFPDVGSEFNFDCFEDKFYISPPSKFYLFSYGIPRFLVESEINLNYRYARREPHEWFFPNGGAASDYNWWTQEKNVPIRLDNEFNYNFTYSRNLGYEKRQLLPTNYNKYDWFKKTNFINGVIGSQPDTTVFNTTDPWLSYKPFDVYEFPSTAGNLVDLKDIESGQIIGRFKNQFILYNSIDVLRERLNASNIQLGVGIFGQRPIEFRRTELGYAGTQHKESVSCEFGTFWVDAKRGQVINVTTDAQNVTDIAAFKKDGKPSGMRNWFKEHLPFKLLRGGITGLNEDQLDNSYNGPGIAMVWDARYRRVFITKKDYQVTDAYKNLIQHETGQFYITPTSSRTITLSGTGGSATITVNGVDYTLTYTTSLTVSAANFVTTNAAAILAQSGATVTSIGETLIFTDNTDSFPIISILGTPPAISGVLGDLIGIREEIQLTDSTYFKDASWTIAYSPVEDCWISFYSFKPNYYIAHQHYFQTGWNNGTELENGLWSHLLTNRSFNVFCGTYYPWIIEVPSVEKYGTRIPESIEYWLDVRHYISEWDFAEQRNLGFNKAWVYNNSSHSGELDLVTEVKNDRRQLSQYPRTNIGSISILQAVDDKKFTYNSFFSRVRNEYNGQSLWLHDINGLKYSLNSQAFNYIQRGLVDRIRGDWFLIRLEYQRDSRFKTIFKWLFAKDGVQS